MRGPQAALDAFRDDREWAHNLLTSYHRCPCHLRCPSVASHGRLTRPRRPPHISAADEQHHRLSPVVWAVSFHPFTTRLDWLLLSLVFTMLALPWPFRSNAPPDIQPPVDATLQASSVSTTPQQHLLRYYNTSSVLPPSARVNPSLQQQTRQPLGFFDIWKYGIFVASKGECDLLLSSVVRQLGNEYLHQPPRLLARSYHTTFGAPGENRGASR